MSQCVGGVQKMVLQKAARFYEHTATTQSVVSLMEQWDSNEWKDILKDLYQYAGGGARLIEPLSEKDIENLTHRAQTLLAEEIQRA